MDTGNTDTNGRAPQDGESTAPPREVGVVVDWLDGGYGFVRPSTGRVNGRGDIFIHRSQVPRRPRSLRPGELISFVRITDERGRWQAVNISIEPRGDQ